MKIKFIGKGDFNNLERYLKKSVSVNANITSILHRYGAEGVKMLSAATPMDTGKTASSWGYEIVVTNQKSKIVWTNSSMAGSTPVAILLQYGHMTGNGGYVEGTDYINPVMRDLFGRMADSVWREVTN